MKFYSDVLDKLFDTQEELVAAEEKHSKKKVVRDELKAALKEAKKELKQKKVEYQKAAEKVKSISNELSETYYTYYVDGKKVSRKEYLEAVEKINLL